APTLQSSSPNHDKLEQPSKPILTSSSPNPSLNPVKQEMPYQQRAQDINPSKPQATTEAQLTFKDERDPIKPMGSHERILRETGEAIALAGCGIPHPVPIAICAAAMLGKQAFGSDTIGEPKTITSDPIIQIGSTLIEHFIPAGMKPVVDSVKPRIEYFIEKIEESRSKKADQIEKRNAKTKDSDETHDQSDTSMKP
ncbi:MAG: hypothetical protein M3R00_10505, partial [Pseudomonadota bacterium]|nr:hypothetical protein [Pseudomonadota bacterium]